jgi:SAM-dependent methyltransferase
MNANKALWEKGDFTRIAETMRASGEALVDRVGVEEGQDVLDLGCGDGTTAVPAAQRGANVLGVDISENLVAAGNARAEALGLGNLSFQEGDASRLDGLDDERFDLAMSVFGAMFAPNPFDVASEMVRVTKPGGRVVMGNWIPNDPTLVAQLLKISAAYSPPPPEGFVSPVKWGVGVPRERISCEPDTWTFEHPGPPSELVGIFRDYYGPTMNAFEAAAADGREGELQAELEDLFSQQNTSDEGTSIDATFLRVTVER